VAVTPEQIRIDANGLTFAALRWGAPEAPLALCLHGYPDTPWTWRHLGPHLAERGWRVVAPFTRGYAPTDLAPDDDYSLVAQSQDAIALRDALGGDDRAVLIGHDWGAAAAHYVTHEAPGHFRRVVTLAVPPMAAALDPARSPRTWRMWGRQLRKSWYMGFNQLPVLAEGGQDTLIPKLWAAWSPGFDAGEDSTCSRRSAAPGAGAPRCATTARSSARRGSRPPSASSRSSRCCSCTASRTAASAPRSPAAGST
jgi:pimeloyl-ACP methyl ester carboxylesterase